MLVLVMAPLGCVGDGGRGAVPPPVAGESPFAPASMRVHPLTHVDQASPDAPAGKCLLVLHLEMRDRFGDSVKGLGQLRVQLFKPGAGSAPGMEVESLTWAIPDFDDPAANSDRFDPATRTYRLPLLADPWVARWLTPEGEGLRGGAPAWLKVRASVNLADGRTVADEFVVQ
jgi:hypothetical protein